MTVRRTSVAALLCAIALALGCGRAPKAQGAEADAATAQPAHNAPRAKGKAPAKPVTPGKVAGKKLKALMKATRKKNLKKIQAAAEELAAAMAKHKAKPEIARKPSYKEKNAAALAAIKKIVEAQSSFDAAAAAKKVWPNCAQCHEEFNPQPQ